MSEHKRQWKPYASNARIEPNYPDYLWTKIENGKRLYYWTSDDKPPHQLARGWESSSTDIQETVKSNQLEMKTYER